MRRSVLAEQVHKVDESNVWISHPREHSEHALSARYEIPSVVPRLRFVDLMEAQRQAGMLQVHRQLGATPGDVFILDSISLSALRNDVVGRDECRQGLIRSHLVEGSARRATRSVEQCFLLEGRAGVIARGRSRATVIPHALHRRLRMRKVTPEPESVSMGEPLILDYSDPLSSDHSTDHVTAMQVASAVERLASERHAHTTLASLKLKFLQYIELEPQLTMLSKVSPSGRLKSRVMQSGQVKAKSIVRLRTSARGTS